MSAQSYYAFRPEIAHWIPNDASIVLDIGCGDGALGRGLKAQRPHVQVYGVEIDSTAADAARAHLDGVHCGDADIVPDGWPQPDCIVFADVLEHMTDPWSCLERWRDRIAPGTTTIVSLPNVLHFSVLAQLRRGRWDYQNAGVLDRTHLRFFTRDTGADMLLSAGFRIEHFARLWRLPTGFARWPGAIARRIDARQRLAALPRPGLRLADFYSIQFLYVAK